MQFSGHWDMFHGSPLGMQMGGQMAFDMHEYEDALVVTADVPGMTEESMDINVSRNTLTISGSVPCPERQDEDARPLYRTRMCGSSDSRMQLPVEVDPGRVEADLEDGVLTIRMEKADPSTTRRSITVNRSWKS